MKNIPDKIQYVLFPNAKPFIDFMVVNDGSGERITQWNVALGPQPTEAQIDAISDAALDAAIVAAINAKEPDIVAIRDQATQAVIDINTFLAITSPNNAQLAAEVKAIDQRQRAIIKALARLAIRAL